MADIDGLVVQMDWKLKYKARVEQMEENRKLFEEQFDQVEKTEEEVKITMDMAVSCV